MRVIGSNATFHNTKCNSIISWRSVLLVKEIGVPGENHRPVASHNISSGKNILAGKFVCG